MSVDFFIFNNMLEYTELNVDITKNYPALMSYFANPSFKDAVVLEIPGKVFHSNVRMRYDVQIS